MSDQKPNRQSNRKGAAIYSSDYNRIFLNVLQDNGVNLTSWLHKAALDFSVMNNTDGFMLYKDIEGFFNRNVETLGLPGLGLQIGEKTDITSHGSLAYTVLSSPNYEEGFLSFQRFLKLRINFLTLALEFSEKEVVFNFTVTEKMTPYIAQFYLECALSGTYTFISQYLKGKTFEITCHFDYPEPEESDIYRKRFGQDIHFNCKSNAFIIKRSYLDDNNRRKNLSIYTMATRQCEAELDEFEKTQSIVNRITTLLFESPWIFPSQEKIADQLLVSIRTLRRKLNDEGTSYQTILDSVKESLAKEYLQNTQWSVEEIADMTGYSEPSNFKRAFKRWSGLTPKEYRNQKLNIV